MLKISGLPYWLRASSSASMQNDGIHGDRHPPGQHSTAEPVDDRCQIDEAARHGDVGNVHSPDLIGPRDREAAQQVRINLVSWRGFGSVGLAIECLDGHPPHQRAHVAAAHFKTLLAEHVAQHATAGERIVQVQLVDAPHQHQVRVRDWRADDSRPWSD